MKIMLCTKCPEEPQFQRLMEALAEDAQAQLEPIEYESLAESGKVIAAYDHERLVGIGHTDRREQLQALVLPNYRNREIEDYMRKLLKTQ